MFQLSREEFMQIFFDDLELPRLARTEFGPSNTFKSIRSGFAKTGVPANLAVVRTMPQALARRIALTGALARETLGLQEEFALATASVTPSSPPACTSELDRIERRQDAIPFLDDPDMRFRNRVWRPEPIAKAVMFCLMDVSASMDEVKKDLAKRFFSLLYLFLTRKYEQVDLVFIRHTDDAEEVDEDTFFHDPRSGGTVVYLGAGARRQDPQRALRDRLERLRGAGVRRRCLRRRSRAQRAVPARDSCCRRCATTRISSSSPTAATRARPRCGRSTSASTQEGEHVRDAARVGSRADLSGVPRAVPEGGPCMMHARCPQGAHPRGGPGLHDTHLHRRRLGLRAPRDVRPRHREDRRATSSSTRTPTRSR